MSWFHLFLIGSLMSVKCLQITHYVPKMLNRSDFIFDEWCRYVSPSLNLKLLVNLNWEFTKVSKMLIAKFVSQKHIQNLPQVLKTLSDQLAILLEQPPLTYKQNVQLNFGQI